MTRVFHASLDFGSVWAVLEGGQTQRVCDESGRALDYWNEVPNSSPEAGEEPPTVVSHRPVSGWIECELGIGEHHPRIWRGEPSPGRQEYEREWAASYGAVSSLVRRMAEVFHFIEPHESNAAAYGHETRQLLIVAATEVESSLRAILAANGYQPQNGDGSRLSTRDYVQLADPMQLRDWQVVIDAHPDAGVYAPFETWDEARPTASLSWYDAYNAVKHDRETNFPRGCLREAITAVAAAYVLVVAQFGEFDNRHFLGLDEFRRTRTPEFARSRSYIPPGVGSLPGWIPTPLFTGR